MPAKTKKTAKSKKTIKTKKTTTVKKTVAAKKAPVSKAAPAKTEINPLVLGVVIGSVLCILYVLAVTY